MELFGRGGGRWIYFYRGTFFFLFILTCVCQLGPYFESLQGSVTDIYPVFNLRF